MRLIDADALIQEWYKINDIESPEDCGARFVGYQEIARFIAKAPTITLDKLIGEWRDIEDDEGLKCSVCGHVFGAPYDYCPSCGARMIWVK